MTREKLAEILALGSIEEQIKALSVSSFSVPKWSDLEKQYDPNEHSIVKDLVRYPVIVGDKGLDDMKRITRGLQRLGVNRMSQAIFSTPVERQYSFDRENENHKTAIDVLEYIYRTDNNIDSENLERCKRNNSSCQVATVWYTVEEPTITEGLESKKSLRHNSYSPMDGYTLWPNTDNNGNLIVISFEYKDSSDTEYFDVYANLEKPEFIRYIKDGSDWTKSEDSKLIEVFPVVYTHMDQPVWGGDTGTTQVEIIEETLSYSSMYIKKNNVPFATMDMGEVPGGNTSTTEESDEDKRRILKVGKGGKVQYVVWDVNNSATEQQIKNMENAFYDDNQIPNISFSNLINSNTSADNKEIMLADSKAKAIDLGGEWQKLFNTELNKIIIPIAKIMFPSLKESFNVISVRSVIKPYSTRTDKERAEFVATAGSAMSLSTQVAYLNKADDVEQEVDAIENERGANANQL